MKTITVKETFEQGMDRKQGGMLKLSAGPYKATEGDGGLSVELGGKTRLIPNATISQLQKLGLITVS
jgi:hypothetical protein